MLWEGNDRAVPMIASWATGCITLTKAAPLSIRAIDGTKELVARQGPLELFWARLAAIGWFSRHVTLLQLLAAPACQ
jgi:hypothetical protein